MLKVETGNLKPHQATLLRIWAQASNRLDDSPEKSESGLRTIRDLASKVLQEQGIYTGYDEVDGVYTYIRG